MKDPISRSAPVSNTCTESKQLSFQANICDYSKLIDAHARDNQLKDAERIIKKMSENGAVPDILTSTTMVHMYRKAVDLDRAKAAFESLRTQEFHQLGESLMREMEARDTKPSEEIFMALLRLIALHGNVKGAQSIATTMQFSGFQPTLESCALLVEAFGKAGDPDLAMHNFDYMIKLEY
ncbi:hypothetical protein HAX54_029768 [Datura stramonium]|uniref:PROP1-like PPR domain-containing protein n=1 Tax=Datura stramonium TaxID=4076 RepID=A0ABS8SAH9_DATST|nr:hypothetical protein [Datura stramonium]